MSRARSAAILAVASALVLWGLWAVLGDGNETADSTRATSEETLAPPGDQTTSTSGSISATSTPAPTTTVSAGGVPTTTATSATVATTVPAGTRRVPEGVWGGQGIRLVVGPSGASVEYDCATGLISQALVLDGAGSFQADGSHTFQPGGPVQPGAPAPAAQPARYSGSVQGSQMQLAVVLTRTGTTLGPFSLGLGQQPLLDRCT